MSTSATRIEVEFSGEGFSPEAASLTVEQAISNLQQQDDPGLRYYAAWWLGRFRVNQPEAIEALLEALKDETDRAPDGGYPLRRNAAKALGKLGDQQVVPALINCLSSQDYYVRESAAQALEMLGDQRCLEALVKLLDGGVEAAQKTPGKPHLRQPYEAVLEALGALGAVEAIPLIEPFLEHFMEKVQYAASRALYQLTGNPVYGERLVTALQGNSLQLRRSALMDLGASGYLAGAEAIANTLAENSLKIIALKGLLENQINQQSELSATSIKIMKLIDQLL
jgi:phycocyanobilin lyase alpha subunit